MIGFWKFLLSLLILSQSATAEIKTLQQQTNDHINPNNYNYDETNKDNDKRTIFANNIENYGWAKHVAIHPSGKKYVLGYGAVDLKYVPVARPIHLRPHMKRPWLSKPINHGWKPIMAPIAPANTQVPPHIHQHPWHAEWTRPIPHTKPILEPVHPVKPVVPPIVPHFRPLVPAFKPVLPQPFVPSPPLFEVTKPNLGVLPLGASFLSPVLTSNHQITPDLVPAQPAPSSVYHGNHNFVPIHQVQHQFIPQVPHLHPSFQSTQPHIFADRPQVVPSPALVPQYLPPTLNNAVLPHHYPHFQQQIPANVVLPHHFQPQAPNPVNAVLPQHFQPQLLSPVRPQHFQPHIPAPPPDQHEQPLIPHHQNIFPQFQQLPFPGHTHFQPQQIHQQLPEGGQHVFNPLNNQQLPNNNPQLFNELQSANQVFTQHSQQIFQQQLPEGQPNLYNQISIDHSTQNGQQEGFIQPGQTDLQLPLHLPQHPSYLATEGQQELNEEGNVFRPSISLEAPYKK